MATATFSPRIGIYGADETATTQSRGCSLWPLGYAAALTEAGGTPIPFGLQDMRPGQEDLLDDLDGILFAARESAGSGQTAPEEWLCRLCQKRRLSIDLFTRRHRSCERSRVRVVETFFPASTLPDGLPVVEGNWLM